MDERKREMERRAQAGDTDAAARLMIECVRTGDMTEGCMSMLAFLGDEVARIALGSGRWVKHLWPGNVSEPGEAITEWCKSAVLLANREGISTRMFAARAWLAVGTVLAKEAEHDLGSLSGGDKPCLTCCGCHEDLCPVPDLWAVNAWIENPSSATREICKTRWNMALRAGAMTLPGARGFLDPVGCYVVGCASDYLEQFGQQWTGIDVNLGNGFADTAERRSPQWVVNQVREGLSAWLAEGAPDPRPFVERCAHRKLERLNLEAIGGSRSYPTSMVEMAKPWKAGPLVCLDCGREMAPPVGALAFEGDMQVSAERGVLIARVRREVVDQARRAGGTEDEVASRLRALFNDHAERIEERNGRLSGEMRQVTNTPDHDPRWLTFEMDMVRIP